jgi:hypothetical protein
MAERVQEISDDERKASIEGMKISLAFRGTEDLPKLLDFLLENCGTLLSAAAIEERHYGRDIASKGFNPGHSRERISKLKERLTKYGAENPDEPIKVERAYVSRMGHIQVAYVFMLVLRQLQP